MKPIQTNSLYRQVCKDMELGENAVRHWVSQFEAEQQGQPVVQPMVTDGGRELFLFIKPRGATR